MLTVIQIPFVQTYVVNTICQHWWHIPVDWLLTTRLLVISYCTHTSIANYKLLGRVHVNNGALFIMIGLSLAHYACSLVRIKLARFAVSGISLFNRYFSLSCIVSWKHLGLSHSVSITRSSVLINHPHRRSDLFHTNFYFELY